MTRILSLKCSLITWFTSRSKDFNEFFEIILSMLESSNDLQEMMRKSEAQDCIISLLEDLLTVTLEDGKYISNTKILWEDIANILKFIFNTLDYQNISEIRNDIKNILQYYLTMEGKEEEDNNGFLEDIFSLINKMSC